MPSSKGNGTGNNFTSNSPVASMHKESSQMKNSQSLMKINLFENQMNITLTFHHGSKQYESEICMRKNKEY
jgi:hypothetical protein